MNKDKLRKPCWKNMENANLRIYQIFPKQKNVSTKSTLLYQEK